MPSKTAAATLTLLSLCAVAMALLEAVVVIYMRQLYYPEQPLELFPLEFLTRYDPMVELSREVSTIVMIITVAFLAERQSSTRRFAAFVYVFGLWDVFLLRMAENFAWLATHLVGVGCLVFDPRYLAWALDLSRCDRVNVCWLGSYGFGIEPTNCFFGSPCRFVYRWSGFGVSCVYAARSILCDAGRSSSISWICSRPFFLDSVQSRVLHDDTGFAWEFAKSPLRNCD